MVLGQADYRTVLKGAFADRVSRNPAYSVRAFSRDLGVAPSFLAEVLKGQKNVSQEGGLKIARSLGMQKTEADYFCLLVQLETTRDPELRALTLEKLQAIRPASQIHDVDVDAFKAISEWYHLPILEMTLLKRFAFNAFNVAKRLGISEVQADLAIARLLRLGLLERTSAGGYRKTKGRWISRTKGPTEAMARFHRGLLEKVLPLLSKSGKPDRYSATDLFPIDPSRMPEIEAAIERCASEIARISDSSTAKSEVYALCTHFFRLT
jgi:uncharacterized protein (TIGR02147 family)